MALPQCDEVPKEYEKECSNFEDGIRRPSEWGKSESDVNHDDYIRKPEEFGIRDGTVESEGVDSESHNDCSNFEDGIRRPGRWGNTESDCRPTECEDPKETCDSRDGNFEDYIRQPVTWGTGAEVADITGNRYAGGSGESSDSRSRIIFPDDELLKNTGDNTDVPPEDVEDRNTGNNDENSDARSRIIFPDDELLKNLRIDKEDEPKEENDDTFIFPDDYNIQ